jgi:hypothetical protein
MDHVITVTVWDDGTFHIEEKPRLRSHHPLIEAARILVNKGYAPDTLFQVGFIRNVDMTMKMPIILMANQLLPGEFPEYQTQWRKPT